MNQDHCRVLWVVGRACIIVVEYGAILVDRSNRHWVQDGETGEVWYIVPLGFITKSRLTNVALRSGELRLQGFVDLIMSKVSYSSNHPAWARICERVMKAQREAH